MVRAAVGVVFEDIDLIIFPGFPEELIDDELEEPGYEVVPTR